jgi:hypothetical protein
MSPSASRTSAPPLKPLSNAHRVGVRLTPKGCAATMRHGLFILTWAITRMTRSDDQPAKPLSKDAGQARAESREARRAAALRTNLARRKTQTRARQGADEPAEPDEPTSPAPASGLQPKPRP